MPCKFTARIREWARQLKQETLALYLAGRHARTPWAAKLLIGMVVAYALSPIDLIPDFIPILGYLDDFVLLPLGIALAVRIIPADVLMECRESARQACESRLPVSRLTGVIIILVWIALSLVFGTMAYRSYVPK